MTRQDTMPYNLGIQIKASKELFKHPQQKKDQKGGIIIIPPHQKNQ